MITLEETLSKYWGYTSFRPLQREAMAAILDGRDSVVVLPTGGGKSLCFQAPALVRGGLEPTFYSAYFNHVNWGIDAADSASF